MCSSGHDGDVQQRGEERRRLLALLCSSCCTQSWAARCVMGCRCVWAAWLHGSRAVRVCVQCGHASERGARPPHAPPAICCCVPLASCTQGKLESLLSRAQFMPGPLSGGSLEVRAHMRACKALPAPSTLPAPNGSPARGCVHPQVRDIDSSDEWKSKYELEVPVLAVKLASGKEVRWGGGRRGLPAGDASCFTCCPGRA